MSPVSSGDKPAIPELMRAHGGNLLRACFELGHAMETRLAGRSLLDQFHGCRSQVLEVLVHGYLIGCPCGVLRSETVRNKQRRFMSGVLGYVDSSVQTA
jgi:hypothetical protein